MPRPEMPGSGGARVPSGAELRDPTRRSSATPFERFLLWERSSRDTIEVKRTYIDMAGDLVAGILLSQIVYWHLPDREGRSRLRVERDGRLWLAKVRTEWWEECRVSPKQADRALETLRERGLIETRIYKFDGCPTVHIRLNEEGFMGGWETQIDQTAAAGSDFTEKGKSILPKGEKPSSRTGEIHIAESGKSITETTTESTAETTTSAPGGPEVGVEDGSGDVVAVVGMLMEAGVTRGVAERLVGQYGGERVRLQVEMVGYRKAEDRAAVLVCAIEEGWAAPAGYRRARANREAALDRRRRREAEEAALRTRLGEEAERGTAEDRFWSGLGEAERGEIVDQAQRALEAKSPSLFGGERGRRRGPIFERMLEAERRSLVRARMGEG